DIGEDIDRAVLAGRRHQPFDRAHVGHIDMGRMHRSAAGTRAGERLDLLGEQIAGPHLCAPVGEGLRDGAADAARRAGDDDAPICELDVHCRYPSGSCMAVSPALRPGAGSPRGRCLKQADGSSALLLPRSGLYICATIVRIERHLPSGTMINPLRLLAVSFLALSVLGRAGSAVAQERRVPSSAAELTLSYAPVVQRVAPAVVNVYAAKVVENRNPFFDDPFFRRFFGGPNSSLPREQVQRSLGSGVIVDPSGLVVTNNHVIEGASEVKVALADKREFEAELVLKDTRSDLAVMRLKGARERFPALEFGNSDELQVGDIVLAIGDPFGVGPTVTHGIVSALARTQIGITDYRFFIQTDAAINPGNSGGALVDMHGRLIGINTAIFSRSGGSQGIGFAIPANMAQVVVASARGGGTAVKRPWLGAQLQAVAPANAGGLRLQRPAGALTASISPGSRAAREGWRTGDLILAVDGQTVEDPNAFDYRFATKPIGGAAQLGVLRGGREAKIPIALETAPDNRRDELVI